MLPNREILRHSSPRNIDVRKLSIPPPPLDSGKASVCTVTYQSSSHCEKQSIKTVHANPNRKLQDSFGPEHCFIKCKKLYRNMTFDENTEILSLENAEIKKVRLVQARVSNRTLSTAR